MAIRNTFVAAGSKDIDALRRSVNNGFQSLRRPDKQRGSNNEFIYSDSKHST